MNDREEAISKVIAERDMLMELLVRISRETIVLQAPSNATSAQPSQQKIYCFTADPDIHGRLQDLSLFDALRMLPTPTQVPSTTSKETK